MTKNEIITKIEALNEWEALMEEAKAEVEALRDSIKAEMHKLQKGLRRSLQILHQAEHFPPLHHQRIRKTPCASRPKQERKGLTQNRNGEGKNIITRPLPKIKNRRERK